MKACQGPRPPRDGGFTLIETMVAMTLATLLMGTMITAVFSADRTGAVVRSQHDITQEAAVVLSRLTRELREAKEIVSVTNAAGPNYSSTGNVDITFDVDFDGNGTIDPYAADPEELTYRFDRTRHQVLLLAASYSTPIIAGGVRDLTLDFKGQGKPWTAFDATTAGGNGNVLLDGFELKNIDSVAITMVMDVGGSTQTLNAGTNLRNLTRG
jgi:prepilin-type N-terminal cleavage/methylation domain-containing protein